MTIDQLRYRARKHGFILRKAKSFGDEMYRVYDGSKNPHLAFLYFAMPLTIEQVEAWLDDLEQANDDEQPTDN